MSASGARDARVESFRLRDRCGTRRRPAPGERAGTPRTGSGPGRGRWPRRGAGEALRDEGAADRALLLDAALEELEHSVTARGGVVHWARDALEANEIVTGLCDTGVDKGQVPDHRRDRAQRGARRGRGCVRSRPIWPS